MGRPQQRFPGYSLIGFVYILLTVTPWFPNYTRSLHFLRPRHHRRLAQRPLQTLTFRWLF
jgi:hypothetical protein